MQAREAFILLLMILSCSTALAAETVANEPPDQELLEFLGGWETADGKWLDPTQMEEMSALQNESVKGEENEKSAN